MKDEYKEFLDEMRKTWPFKEIRYPKEREGKPEERHEHKGGDQGEG